MSWHAQKTSSGQGLVIDDDTGRNVAVAYDEKDMLLLAVAPDLLSSLEEMVHAGFLVVDEVQLSIISRARKTIREATQSA